MHMKTPLSIVVAFLTGIGFAGGAPDAGADEPSAIRLFNGKDLDDWNGDPRWFRVENGAIVAGDLQAERIPHNYFLATDKQYHDFELTLQVKLRKKFADRPINGGIQLRSVRVPDNTEMSGYQADIGTGVWGALYDESRRRKFLTPKPEDARLERLIRDDDWNDYRVVCKGRNIKIWVNGKQITDYHEENDEFAAATGQIAVQVHSAPYPVEILYRDLILKEL